jgi:hypothetical protein
MRLRDSLGLRREKAQIETYEFRLTDQMLRRSGEPVTAEEVRDERVEMLIISQLLRSTLPEFTGLRIFVESGKRELDRRIIAALAKVPAKVATIGGDCFPGGFKLRCGGRDESCFPSPEHVAGTIIACRDAGVPLKFTAGLHHPIRHFSTEVGTYMHGFINVFVAGVLALARRLGEEQLWPILEDEDRGDFGFDDAGLRWKDIAATTEEIVAARKQVVSFGSCSFDEPRDDLRKLGWLETGG